MSQFNEILLEVHDAMEGYQDYTIIDVILERVDEDEAKAKNDEIKPGVIASLKKLIDKVISMLKDVMENVKKFFMGGESASEKKAREEVEELMRKYPEMKKMEVPVIDAAEYQKIYDDAVKKLKKESEKEDLNDGNIQKIMQDTENTVKEMSEAAKDPIKSLGKKAVSFLAMDAAMHAAKKNRDTAAVMNDILKLETEELDTIRSQLGEDSVSNFKLAVNKSARKGAVGRFIAKLRGQETSVYRRILDNQYEQIARTARGFKQTLSKR